MGNPRAMCEKNNCSFRHDLNKRGKSSPSNPSPNSFMRQNERKSSRTRSPRGRSLSGRTSRWPCKDYLRETCNNSFCERWHPPECLYYKTKSGCRFGEKCSFAHRQVNEQPTKRSKSNDDKSAVVLLKKENWQEREPVSDACHDRTGKPVRKSGLKLGQNSSRSQFSNARQMGCVFQDMTPPKSILRKGTDMPRPIQRVKFAKSLARHTEIRDQNPSLGHLCPWPWKARRQRRKIWISSFYGCDMDESIKKWNHAGLWLKGLSTGPVAPWPWNTRRQSQKA